MQSEAAGTWLVSSNPFDVLGALHAGLKAAWVQRDPSTPFDPWGEAPTLTVSSLDELQGALVAQQCA
jgi:2-haloacid dehalogenase